MAPKLGLSLEEFDSMNRGTLLSVEAAGPGFAAAVALAEQYAGQEISSTQALIDASFAMPDEAAPPVGVTITTTANASEADPARHEADGLRDTMTATVTQQATSWNARSIFERQRMVRDFRKRAGMPIANWIEISDGYECS